VRSGEREIGSGRPRLPDVLADGRADEGLPAAEQDELAPGLEVAVLVEHSVVGQELLVVHRLDLPVGAHGTGVEEVAVEVGGPDERSDALRLGRHRVERLGGRSEETGPQEQVLGRIARRRELGEEDEIRPCLARLLQTRDDSFAVSVEVADDGVHLCERKPHQA